MDNQVLSQHRCLVRDTILLHTNSLCGPLADLQEFLLDPSHGPLCEQPRYWHLYLALLNLSRELLRVVDANESAREIAIAAINRARQTPSNPDGD